MVVKCIYCSKVYAKVGKCLSTHERMCSSNPSQTIPLIDNNINKLTLAKTSCLLCGRAYKHISKHKCLSVKDLPLDNLATLVLDTQIDIEVSDELIESMNGRIFTSSLADLRKTLPYKSYLKDLSSYKKDEGFLLLHLNVNSLYSKMKDISEILNMKRFDVVSLNESKLDSQVPNRFINNTFYNCMRRDRSGKKGGGIITYVKKEYKLLDRTDANNLEAIYYKIQINNQSCNFINVYNPPSEKDVDFLSVL